MARSLWLFNVLLALLVLGLLGVLIDSLVGHRSLSATPRATPMAHRPAAEVPKREDPARSVRPRRRPLSDFDIILKRDPFKSPVAQPPKKPIVKRPPPAPRLPTLFGTIFVGDERKAILKEGKRQDVYSIGQSVAGGILTKIEVDRVVITRGKHRSEILMKNAIQESRPKANPAAKATLSPPSPSRSSRSAQRLVQRRQDQASEKMRRRRERLRQLRERLQQRRRSRGSSGGASR